MVEALLVLAVLAVAIVVISGPLRAGRTGEEEAADSAERAELEAAKEAKYREIREAELDHRMGKLARRDWLALDAELRAQAVDLLRRLDALGASEGEREGQRDTGGAPLGGPGVDSDRRP